MIRIGQGFDVHAFAEEALAPGNTIQLGGVPVPHERRVVAHSDGDLLLHALTDAILGALALGDIGHYFPDTDPAFKGVDSAQLLARVWQDVQRQGYRLGNADITLIGERPKLSLYVPAIRERIAALLGVDTSAISVKATTTEKLGFTGRSAGLFASAIWASMVLCAWWVRNSPPSISA